MTKVRAEQVTSGSATANYVLTADGAGLATWEAGGSVSFGSNSNDVGNPSAAGASALSSRADHVHRGVRAVSHASNTFFGDVTLQTEGSLYIVSPASNTLKIGSSGSSGAGGASLTVEEVDGSPSVAATKLVLPNGTLGVVGTVATYTPASSGGLTQAYVGYNTAGGTWETMTSQRVYAKKVTLANDCLLTNIEAHVRQHVSDNVSTLSVAIYDDSAGTPNNVIAENSNPATSLMMDDTSGAGGIDVARWFGIPVGQWLVAGDYWICVASLPNNASAIQIAKDGSGTDRYYTSGGAWFADWGWYSPTTSTDKYSIRANTIR